MFYHVLMLILVVFRPQVFGRLKKGVILSVVEVCGRASAPILRLRSGRHPLHITEANLIFRTPVVFRLQNSNSFMDDLYNAAGLDDNLYLILDELK